MAITYATRAAAVTASKGKGVHKMPNGKWMVGSKHPTTKKKKAGSKKSKGRGY